MALLDAVPAGMEDAQRRICMGKLHGKRTDQYRIELQGGRIVLVFPGDYWNLPVYAGDVIACKAGV